MPTENPSDQTLHPHPATPAPENVKKSASELTLRIITALILIPLVLYVIYYGGWVYLGIVIAFTLIAQREFYGLIEDKGAEPMVMLGLGFGLAVALIAYWGNEYHTTMLIMVSLLGLMLAQLRKAEITEALASISGTFFGVFYVAWLLYHAVLLRFFDNSLRAKYDAIRC